MPGGRVPAMPGTKVLSGTSSVGDVIDSMDDLLADLHARSQRAHESSRLESTHAVGRKSASTSSYGDVSLTQGESNKVCSIGGNDAADTPSTWLNIFGKVFAQRWG